MTSTLTEFCMAVEIIYVFYSKKKTCNRLVTGFLGGDKRDRTADLLNAIQALSQLSYTPVFN